MFVKKLLSHLSNKEIQRPIFILGCGRSGTTIFGTTLSRHNQITYLNERRDLWFDAYPETDIWTPQALDRQGKINLDASNTNDERNRKLRRLFYKETLKKSRPVLVEKLPINNFRTDFLNTIFPDARFIHIYRNGLEVAKSIQTWSEEKNWFGDNDFKWEQLKKYSQVNKSTSELAALCDNYYHKGLLEWRLSTESVVNFLNTLPKEKYMEFSYAAFSSDPAKTISQVLDYIEIDNDSSVTDFASNKVSRKTNNLRDHQISETEARLGGTLLPLSMESDITAITDAFRKN